jgi:predicted nucleic acid-binding protein
MTLFVDSSTWFAAANRRERWNVRAKEILASGEPMVTSDHVLVESWLLLNSRIHRDAAERFWEGLRAGAARIEQVESIERRRGQSGVCSPISTSHWSIAPASL